MNLMFARIINMITSVHIIITTVIFAIAVVDSVFSLTIFVIANVKVVIAS